MLSWLARRPRFGPLEPWQRNQYVIVLTVALSQVAFDLTQPFIPLYIRDLGVTDLADASLWSGLVIGIGPLCAGIMGPVWGSLADRYGRKAMVLRALVLISVMQAVSAFVPNVQWLFVVRVIMGLFAGFTTMAMALAVSVSPRARMGQAIGLIQAAQLAPTAIGPTLGGVLSDTLGLRANFLLTGVILIVPASLLFFLVKDESYESAPEPASAKPSQEQGSRFGLFALPGFAAALGILFLARFTDRALPPILPLFLIDLDTPTAQLATITGLVVSAGALAAAGSAMLYGRWARPDNTLRLLAFALAGGAAFSVLFALAESWVQVVVLRVVLGLLAGGSLSLAYTLGARLAPPERSALALSVLASCAMLGGAASPVLAGVLGQGSLRNVFLANVVAYLIALGLAAVAMQRARPVDAEAAAASKG
jgi:MFS transporter, DHA1 family, multidrug resistance protein